MCCELYYNSGCNQKAVNLYKKNGFQINNEIVGSDVRESLNGNGIINHREAVNNMLNNKIKRGYGNLDTIIHTDQGAVYSSVSFNNIFNS